MSRVGKDVFYLMCKSCSNLRLEHLQSSNTQEHIMKNDYADMLWPAMHIRTMSSRRVLHKQEGFATCEMVKRAFAHAPSHRLTSFLPLLRWQHVVATQAPGEWQLCIPFMRVSDYTHTQNARAHTCSARTHARTHARARSLTHLRLHFPFP
eukprot:2884462-Pleurochrysis_carterae.AAC.1